jgi:murein DD-endopeptidase MepM/ murein hydrolase activator NlpD
MAFADPNISDNAPNPNYPQGYFQSPVGGQWIVGGTFGELRANHFHSGIDLSPGKKKDKEPIFAAAEGYISRIKIEGGGYGQALYIAHSNGFTTVYAHLDRFASDIQAFVRKKQYESESFTQDLTLSPADLPVARGQHIGNMGNRGHSFGQHLHFEIRETKTDKPINPLLFGFKVNDNLPPSVQQLKVYYFNEKQEVIDTKILYPLKKPDGTFGILGDTLSTSASYIGFALKSYDRDDNKNGENGIFRLDLSENNVPIYNFKAEAFTFNETRYLNAHIDFYEQRHRNSYFHRLFTLPGNQLSMYGYKINNGILNVKTEGTKIDIFTADISDNASKLSFILIKNTENVPVQPPLPPYNYILPYNEPSIIKPKGASFYFPKNSFYENIYLRLGQVTEGGTADIYSDTYQLHDTRTPVHNAFTINIKPTRLPDSLKSKAFIAYCVREGTQILSCGGMWADDGSLMAKTAAFGNYCIMVDRTPPTIKPISFAADMRKAQRMAFKITDNHEVTGSGTGLKYRAEVDGNWLLMEFDAKRDLLYHQFDGQISEGLHSFKLTVTDNRGNESVFERQFRL